MLWPSPARLPPSAAACAKSLRQFNTFVTDDQLDVLLTELSELLDAGLLTLRPGRSGEIVQPHVRGLLGLLVAVQSLAEDDPRGSRPHHPEPRQRAGASLAPPCR